MNNFKTKWKQLCADSDPLLNVVCVHLYDGYDTTHWKQILTPIYGRLINYDFKLHRVNDEEVGVGKLDERVSRLLIIYLFPLIFVGPKLNVRLVEFHIHPVVI